MSGPMSSGSGRRRRSGVKPGRWQPRLPTAPSRTAAQVAQTSQVAQVAQTAQVAQAASTVLKASTPEDLVTLVPYLMGFRPTESLVVLALQGKQVGLTARIDLPGSGGLPDDPLRWRPTLDHLLAAVRQQQPTSVALVGFSERPEVAAAALRTTIEALVDDERQPIPISEAVRTDGSRWWSMLCENPRCCPAVGTPFEPATNRLAAEAVFAGMSVLGDREQLRATLSGPASVDEPQLLELLAAAERRLDGLPRSERMQRMRTLVELGTHLSREDQPEPLPTAALLELAALTADLTVRDVAWAAIERETAVEHLRLWQAVVAVTPARSAVAAVCLLAAAAWIAGNGALQVCAVERAFELDPDYSLADLLSDLLDRAVPPYAWDEIAVTLREELGVA